MSPGTFATLPTITESLAGATAAVSSAGSSPSLSSLPLSLELPAAFFT